MLKKINLLFQYIVPQHMLSRLIGYIADCRWVWLKNLLIKRFIQHYNVDIFAAVSERLNDYPNFNSFFTRGLKPELRPVVQLANEVACPVDGKVSQIGAIKTDTLLQAKGFYFNLGELLGGSKQDAEPFYDGVFTTIYLSPKDYHRVHMPLSGRLRETIYVPGKLFSVNLHTTNSVPNLFARNERLVCIFDTEIGPMAMILVGALIVCGIQTVWNPAPQTREITRTSFPPNTNNMIYLARGAELGHFKMGSTVIVLFPKNTVKWVPTIQENSVVRMGQLIGTTAGTKS